MRYFFLLIAASLVMAFAACSNTSTNIVPHIMVVSPHDLTFAKTDTLHTLSITHTCTCPFTWTCTSLDTTGTLIVASGTGDNTAVPVKVNRAMMKSDTLNTRIAISSGYGVDTVRVTVYR